MLCSSFLLGDICQSAMEKSLLWGEEIPIGILFKRTDVPSLHAAEPVVEN
jgi:hypothetical protein